MSVVGLRSWTHPTDVFRSDPIFTMMSATPLFLRPDVQVEPLIDQWYAWSQLIPPVTLARNTTERHLKIMESYLASPDIHAAAVKNPRMQGGPFIDFGGGRVDEIKSLHDRTLQERTALIELSRAVTELDAIIGSKAKGFTLQDLYPQVPGPLRGYVELTYDLNNQPSFRLFEPLLYRSAYFERGLQSLMLSVTRGDDRPFVLSTPRLPSDALLHWRVAFDDPAVDGLFRLKSIPQQYPAIRETVTVENGSEPLLRALLTTEPPPRYERYKGRGARWRYFGHACVLVETANTSVLFDPVLSYTYDSTVSRYTYLDLPDALDYVLITHNHQDHVLIETLLQIRHKTRCIIVPRGSGTLQDPSLKLALEQIGFTNVVEVGDLDEVAFDDGTITAVPFLGEHADLDVRCKSAYLVRIGRHSLLFAADSSNIEPRLYEHLHRALGDIEVLFIGMECNGAPLTWLYGTLMTRPLDRAMDQSRRLAGSNYTQAMQMVGQFRCCEVYVYAMGQEPWLNHVMSLKYTERSKPILESNKLLENCRARGIIAERLFGEREMFLAE
jgi:L-ascorbate metabolism protein UlaG (beta-lactamase superfamily)